MPKKQQKHKKAGEPVNKPLLLKEDMQEYAKVIKILGGNVASVTLPDTTQYRAKIAGRIYKRSKIYSDDIVLISRRDFADNIVDIIHKYSPDDIKQLQKMGEIPEFFLYGNFDDDCQGDIGIEIREEEPEEFDFENI